MARLYLDHNVSLHVIPVLVTSGHDVVTARDLGAARRSDEAQLLFATQAGRILVTLDRRDFTMLHDAWLSWAPAFGVALPAHPGILVLDLRSPDELARILLSFLAAIPAERLANGLFWWHRLDGWRRRVAAVTWEPYAVRDPAVVVRAAFRAADIELVSGSNTGWIMAEGMIATPGIVDSHIHLATTSLIPAALSASRWRWRRPRPARYPARLPGVD